MRYQEKGEPRGDEGSSSLKSAGGGSKTMLGKVASFAGVQLRVGLRGSQYAAGDKIPLVNE